MNLDEPFKISLRVYYEDTDAAGVVYYVNYLKFMERARTEFLRSLGQGHQGALSTGQMFVVVESSAKYHRPAKLDDLLQVTAEVAGVGRARMVFRQVVIRGEETLCTGEFTIACVDSQTMRPVSITKALRSQCLDPTNKSGV